MTPAKDKNPKITIEKHVPIPDKGQGRRSYWAKVLLEMEAGDSFLVPAEKGKKENDYKRATIAVAAKRLGIKITTRVTDEGMRVWRTADDGTTTS